MTVVRTPLVVGNWKMNGAFEANKPTYSWAGATLTITGGVDGTTFKNDVTSTIIDVAGNTTTNALLVDSSADETAPTVVTKLGDDTIDVALASN